MHDDVEPDLQGRVLGGRYRLVRRIGGGGMGAVYEAVQQDLGRRVAVKVLRQTITEDRDQLERFRREALAAAQLGHPNVVQVTDFCDAPGDVSFLVMELVEGRSLSDILRDEAPMSPSRVVTIAQQLLSGLGAAHAAGIVHRDLKPGNVMVIPLDGSTELVKVVDFGLAKMMEGEGYAKLTRTGAVIGTPSYMSPEQARGDACDHRSDLYAVSVLLYAALTGRLPFRGETPGQRIQQILTESPAPIEAYRPDVPRTLSDVILRGLAKDPAERYADADAMSRALPDPSSVDRAAPAPLAADWDAQAVEHTQPLTRGADASPSTSAGPAAPASPKGGTKLWALGMLAATGLGAATLAAGAGVWWWSRSDRAEAAAPATAGSPPAAESPPATASQAAPAGGAASQAGPSSDKSDSAPRVGTLHEFLPHALRRAQAREQDAELARVMGIGVREDGTIDLQHGKMTNRWQFGFSSPSGNHFDVIYPSAKLPRDYPTIARQTELEPSEGLKHPENLPDSDEVLDAYERACGGSPTSQQLTLAYINTRPHGVVVTLDPSEWAAKTTPDGELKTTSSCEED